MTDGSLSWPSLIARIMAYRKQFNKEQKNENGLGKSDFLMLSFMIKNYYRCFINPYNIYYAEICRHTKQTIVKLMLNEHMLIRAEKEGKM